VSITIKVEGLDELRTALNAMDFDGAVIKPLPKQHLRWKAGLFGQSIDHPRQAGFTRSTTHVGRIVHLHRASLRSQILAILPGRSIQILRMVWRPLAAAWRMRLISNTARRTWHQGRFGCQRRSARGMRCETGLQRTCGIFCDEAGRRTGRSL
jgi:hypothetical protein